jgi:hypothetical protein
MNEMIQRDNNLTISLLFVVISTDLGLNLLSLLIIELLLISNASPFVEGGIVEDDSRLYE